MASVSLNYTTLKQGDSHFTIQPLTSLGPFERTPPIALKKVYLEALKRVCEWEARQAINLSTHFQQHLFLVSQEIDSLTRHLGQRRKGNVKKSLVAASTTHTWPMLPTTFAGWPKKSLQKRAHLTFTEPLRMTSFCQAPCGALSGRTSNRNRIHFSTHESQKVYP